MKLRHFYYGALGVTALLAGGCASDTPDTNQETHGTQVRYLRVNIMGAPDTRAAEFDYGTDDENYVDPNNIFLDFYDRDGNFVVRCFPNIAENDWKEHNPNVSTSKKYAQALVEVEIAENQQLPVYVICYLNPVDYGSGYENNFRDLRNLKRYYFRDKAGTGNFAMNNSCYYGEDPIAGGDAKVKISGTPIVEEKFYKSKDLANADDASSVDIYVERYAAKVQFTMNTTAQTGTYAAGGQGIYPYTGSTNVNGATVNYSLQFVPEAWTINADAPDMYAVKNFARAAGEGIPTYDQVDEYLGGWDSWNDDTNHRSYWACSPGFFADQFPRVSDNIIDIASQSQAGATGAGMVVAPYALKYYSYNQITSTAATNTSTGKGNTDFAAAVDGTLPKRYALENTMGKAAYTSVNPKAAAPSVLIVGSYKVNYGGQQLADNTCFYIFNNSIYFENRATGDHKNPKTSSGEDVNNVVYMKDYFIARQQTLYVQKDGQEEGATPTYELLTSDNAGEALDYLEVMHPNANVRGTNVLAHRYVTLQVKFPDTHTKQIYYRETTADETKFVPVTNDNINEVNKMLWNGCGVAASYHQGHCYYSIPIHHLGYTENEKDRPYDEETGVLDWKKLRVGDMGLVRNHVYKIAVDAVTGLATGINDPDAPIVPPMDKDSYWLKYRINILNWRVVPEQKGIVL